MKIICITTILCLIGSWASAQRWTIDYLGEHPTGRTHITSGFVDLDGVTFLAGYTGPDTDHPEAFFMRIEADGSFTTLTYQKESCRSRATSIVETDNHQLFVAGNLYDSHDDYVLILLLDKQLNILNESVYEKEVTSLSFGTCVADLDTHNHVIVSTTVEVENGFNGTDDYGVFFKFDNQGNLVSRRYLIEEYPDPLFFIKDFHLRQLWYKEDETILCLAPGYGGVMAFITFDSAFNYIEEHQIWRNDEKKSDHTLHHDCYTDYWYSEDEALFFSSRGDYDHNDLRISRINTQGTYLDYILLTQTPDTIYEPGIHRCMATANDSTIYYSFCYHTYPLYPGIACVYRFNKQLEITGRYLKDDCENYRAALVFPTSDNGCIVVNHYSPQAPLEHSGHPFIERLSEKDFEHCPLTVTQTNYYQHGPDPFPNPADNVIHIPLNDFKPYQIRCQIYDHQGRLVMDRKIGPGDADLQIDVSGLKPGAYHYRIYTQDKTLLSKKFIKQ